MDTNDCIVASDDPAVELITEAERALSAHAMELANIFDLRARNEIGSDEARSMIEKVGREFEKRWGGLQPRR